MTENALISRAALARLAGVTRAAVTKACRDRLAPACIGPRVDLSDPSTVAYLSAHGVSDVARAAALEPPRARLPDGLRSFERELRGLLVSAHPSLLDVPPLKSTTGDDLVLWRTQEQALLDAARAFAAWQRLELERRPKNSPVATPIPVGGSQESQAAVAKLGPDSPATPHDERTLPSLEARA